MAADAIIFDTFDSSFHYSLPCSVARVRFCFLQTRDTMTRDTFFYYLGCIQFTAFGHVEEHTLSGLVNTQSFPFLVDMFDH